MYSHSYLLQDLQTVYLKLVLQCHTRDICLADGTVKQCPEVYINVSTPFISGDIVALILDTPLADLVVGYDLTLSKVVSVFCKSISCFLSQILNS
jgi:hypothetical protein